MNTIGERLKHLIENKGITAYELSSSTTISESTLSRILNYSTKPNLKTSELLAKYFKVSKEWIITGNSDNEYEPLENKNGNKFQELPNGKFVMTVPLVPAKAYASYINEYCDAEFVDGLIEVSFVVDSFARGNYKAFEIKGDSMNNKDLNDNPDGAHALGRELNRQHWKDGFRDSVYGWIIVHKESIVCKDITVQDMEKGIITCHSRNPAPEFGDFTVELNDVLQIFKVIKRTF